MTAAVPSDADELYGLPLGEFTAARNALAKQMASGGDKAAAAEVRRLPKPSKTAWALNQLARRRGADVEALLAAGRRVREAQQRALEGDAGDLREATRAEHDQVTRLVDAALALLGEGAGGAERLRTTLHAAATDPQAGELLRRGRLVTEIETSGFGLEGMAEAELVRVRAAERAPGGRSAAKAADDDATARASKEAEERAHREARKAAEREAERLRREAERARDRARRLLEEAERAEARAREARADAEAAADVAGEAERRAVEASGRPEALDRQR